MHMQMLFFRLYFYFFHLLNLDLCQHCNEWLKIKNYTYVPYFKSMANFEAFCINYKSLSFLLSVFLDWFENLRHLLSGLECNFVILSPVWSFNFRKIESLWEKIMNQCTEGHSVCPGRCKVFNFDILLVEKK